MFNDIPRPGLWKRLLIGGFLCIFAAAAATSVAAFHEVDKIVSALEVNPELKLGKNTLATTDPGQPQTLLILGSDQRPKNNVEGGSGARSDTIMLVRLEPAQGGHGDHVAAARPEGATSPGTAWTRSTRRTSSAARSSRVDTVKQLTGLPINHVINVTFKGFWRAVNAIGCVYTDVDRDYFNDTAEFTYINIDPGYQRLCARKALQYVRYRHYGHGPRPLGPPAGLPAPDEAAGHLHGPDLEARPAGEDLRPQHGHRRRAPEQVGGAAAAEAGGVLGRPSRSRRSTSRARSGRASWRRRTPRSRSWSSASST